MVDVPSGEGQENDDGAPDMLTDQPCPMCHENKLTLMEKEVDIPFFGICHIFSMDCGGCDYHMADVEADEEKEPAKYTLEVSAEADLKIRVVKSSQATIKVPRIITVSPGPVSNGFVTNVEGIINRIKKVIDDQRDGEDPEVCKKAKNLSKKLHKVLWGQETLTLIIEDPSGNSAIISDEAVKSKL